MIFDSSWKFFRSNVVGIVKLRDFALITPEQYHLTVKNLLEFHTRTSFQSIFHLYFHLPLSFQIRSVIQKRRRLSMICYKNFSKVKKKNPHHDKTISTSTFRFQLDGKSLWFEERTKKMKRIRKCPSLVSLRLKMWSKKCYNEKLSKKPISSVKKNSSSFIHFESTWSSFSTISFSADNRRKIQRKKTKTTDYTALVKRTIKGNFYHWKTSSISFSFRSID